MPPKQNKVSRRNFLIGSAALGYTLASARGVSILPDIVDSTPNQTNPKPFPQTKPFKDLNKLGVNSWNLLDYSIADQLRLLEFIDKLGVKHLRVFINDNLEPKKPGQYNDKILKSLDWLIGLINRKEYDIKLILALFDCHPLQHSKGYFGSLLGGFSSPYYKISQEKNPWNKIFDFYTNPKTIELFQKRIKHILTHKNIFTGNEYRKEPAILGFDIANEPEVPIITPPLYNMWVLAEWLDKNSALIKELAPDKYVLPGTRIGPILLGVNIGLDPFELSSLDCLDAITVHLFHPYTLQPLDYVLTKAAQIQKPTIIEEFGFIQDDELRAISIENFLDPICSENGCLKAGALLWGVGLEKRLISDPYHVLPSDELTIETIRKYSTYA